MQQEDDEVVESESDQRDDKERDILPRNLGALAFKCPKPIPKIVVGSSEDEAEGVGDVLIPAKLLLAEPCGAEIDHHTRKADYTELQKFEYQCAVNHGL